LAKDRARQIFVDLAVTGDGFLAFAVCPDIMTAAASQEAPAAFRQPSLQIPTFHRTM
jgi:hypothetical protein